MKVYRDWRISGDTAWLRALWPKVKQSLDYCIETWDPRHDGLVEEPHHNTYDIEFWGPDGMCTSFYLGALQAAVAMGRALGDETPLYAELLAKGTAPGASRTFQRRIFYAAHPMEGLARRQTRHQGAKRMARRKRCAILEKEGPKYQYGTGCLSDGVLGAWMALVCGVGQVLDPAKVTSHLRAVHRYNLKQDLYGLRRPAAPLLRLRRGRRLAALHLAQGRPAFPALSLFQRSLDRHRIPVRLAHDAHGAGQGGTGSRARLPRPLRRPRAQSV